MEKINNQSPTTDEVKGIENKDVQNNDQANKEEGNNKQELNLEGKKEKEKDNTNIQKIPNYYEDQDF